MANNFSDLRDLIKTGAVLTPTDEGYKQSIVRWSHAAIRQAKVVVQPGNAEEVSAAIKYATANKIPLVVMGGGHSTSGSSSSDDGMVVDLRKINSVVVNNEEKTVTFGGGCKWREVDEECAKYGVATVGGTVNHTGVGGLTLGGGYGWLTSKYGLTIDNVIAVQVVLADGKIVTASDSENSDLFWAIRGAGQNYGAVTSFTSKVYEQGDVWSGPIVFTLDKMPEIVKFANWFHENNTGDESFWFGPLGGMPGVPMACAFTMVFKNGTKEEGEAFFKGLTDIGPVANLAKTMSYPQVNDQVPNRDEEKRRLQGGTNFVMPLDDKLVADVTADIMPFLQEKGIGEGSGIIFEVFPNKKVREVSNSATAFAARGDYYHAATMFSWDDVSLDSEVREVQRNLIKKLKDRGTKADVGQYNNYDGEYIDPSSAFGENLARLRELKTKYDPTNVFHNWHSVWPSTSEKA